MNFSGSNNQVVVLIQYKLYMKWFRAEHAKPYSISNKTLPFTNQSPEERRRAAKYCKCSKTGRQWTLEDYCKYCTVEVPEDTPLEKDPCALCGIAATLEEEREETLAQYQKDVEEISNQIEEISST